MAATADLVQHRPSADPEDSNVSSPLSEVDDKDAHDEVIEHMQLDSDHSSNAGDENEENNNDPLESDSALSEPGSDLGSDAGNDTEAETERLYDTPKNQRQRDVVVDQFNNGEVFEHTPSKLRRSAAVVRDDEDEDGDASNSDDERSVASSDAGDDESPSKPSMRRANAADDFSSDSQGRKRKRSPVASESDQPVRKRKPSVGEASAEDDDDTAMNDDEKLAAQLQSGIQSGAEDEDDSPNRDTATDVEAPNRKMRSGKKSSRSSSTRSATKAGDDSATDIPDEGADIAAEEEVQEEEEAEVDEAEIAARNQEEQERKEAAFRDWSHIEEMFNIFRDRLYKDRLQRIEDEEQSLVADVPTHKEYLNMKQCLDERFKQKTQEFNTEYNFRIKAQETWAVAQRAQIWSQFLQAVREKREQALEALNKQWYDVQTTRRNAHSIQDWGLLFPKDHTQRVKNAIAYGNEVSTLSGLAKYEGFPSGPEMKGASASELKSDFLAMEKSRKVQQKPTFPARDDYQPASFNRLGPAGEQFIKDTPWANPNHSAHKATILNTVAKPTQNSSKSDAVPTKLSESPELSRSILNQTAHAMKGVGGVQAISQPSTTAV